MKYIKTMPDLLSLLDQIGMNQVTLCRTLGIPPSTFRSWSSGHRPAPSYIYDYVVLGLKNYYATPRTGRDREIKRIVEQYDVS